MSIEQIALEVAPVGEPRASIWSAVKQDVIQSRPVRTTDLEKLFGDPWLVEIFCYSETVFGQRPRRHDGTPYFSHCVGMAEIACAHLDLRPRHSLVHEVLGRIVPVVEGRISHDCKAEVVALCLLHDVIEDIPNIDSRGLESTLADIGRKHPDFKSSEQLLEFVNYMTFSDQKKQKRNLLRKQFGKPELDEVGLYVDCYLMELYQYSKERYDKGCRFYDVIFLGKNCDRIHNTITLMQYDTQEQSYNPIRDMSCVKKGAVLCTFNLRFIEQTTWNPFLYFLHQRLLQSLEEAIHKNIEDLTEKFRKMESRIQRQSRAKHRGDFAFDLGLTYRTSRAAAQDFIKDWQQIGDYLKKLDEQTKQLGKRYGLR